MSNKRYLVACSAGPDSMALLDIFRKKYEVMVSHINYHHRPTADRDENILAAYCKKHNLRLFVDDYIPTKGNFQDRARVFRYERFAYYVNEYELDGVLVAHHQDDLIETYLLQKQRGSTPSYYGLRQEVLIKGVKIIRPLLDKTKKELQLYLEENGIPYGIDESNLSDDYSRNKIRHQIIDKLNAESRKEILLEIKEKNSELELVNTKVESFINKRTIFPANEFLNFEYLNELIRYLLSQDLSDDHIKEIIKALQNNGVDLKIHDKFISREYDSIEVYFEKADYTYTFEKIDYKSFPYFKLTDSGDDFHGVSVSADDFPLTIRNYQPGDKIKMRYGTKKINRFFIDKKIRYSERKTWPIMLNRNNEVILVPGIGSNVNHYSKKHNVYMLKLNLPEE